MAKKPTYKDPPRYPMIVEYETQAKKTFNANLSSMGQEIAKLLLKYDSESSANTGVN